MGICSGRRTHGGGIIESRQWNWALLPCFLLLAMPTLTLVYCIADVDVLVAFKSRIVHDPDNVLASWDATLADPCTWFHVTCDAHSRVIRLDLGNEGLKGTLAPELGDLDRLQYLLLYKNNFAGPIPGDLGKLHSLVALDLSNNQLSGPIPQQLDHLEQPHNLKFLYLNNNRLSGAIPATLGIINLRRLDLSHNDFDGFLPTTFSRYGSTSFFPGNKRLCGGPPLNKPC